MVALPPLPGCPKEVRRSVNNMGKERKRLPVGIENFEQMIHDNYYYVDKTGLVRDLLQPGGMVMGGF